MKLSVFVFPTANMAQHLFNYLMYYRSVCRFRLLTDLNALIGNSQSYCAVLKQCIFAGQYKCNRNEVNENNCQCIYSIILYIIEMFVFYVKWFEMCLNRYTSYFLRKMFEKWHKWQKEIRNNVTWKKCEYSIGVMFPTHHLSIINEFVIIA